MIRGESNSDFDPNFKRNRSAENLVNLWGKCSVFIRHITRLFKKINEKLSMNNNFKTIKCLEEQLHQIYITKVIMSWWWLYKFCNEPWRHWNHEWN